MHGILAQDQAHVDPGHPQLHQVSKQGSPLLQGACAQCHALYCAQKIASQDQDPEHMSEKVSGTKEAGPSRTSKLATKTGSPLPTQNQSKSKLDWTMSSVSSRSSLKFLSCWISLSFELVYIRIPKICASLGGPRSIGTYNPWLDRPRRRRITHLYFCGNSGMGIGDGNALSKVTGFSSSWTRLSLIWLFSKSSSRFLHSINWLRNTDYSFGWWSGRPETEGTTRWASTLVLWSNYLAFGTGEGANLKSPCLLLSLLGPGETTLGCTGGGRSWSFNFLNKTSSKSLTSSGTYPLSWKT